MTLPWTSCTGFAVQYGSSDAVAAGEHILFDEWVVMKGGDYAITEADCDNDLGHRGGTGLTAVGIMS